MVFALLLSTRLQADTVWFSDDHPTEVIFEKETATALTYTQGRAKITLPKKSLRFEYASAADNECLRAH